MSILVDMSNPELSLDGVFRALADPTRRAMLASLATGDRTVGELAAPFAMSFAAASKHVKVLEQAGLIVRRVAGRAHVCRLEAGPLDAARGWLAFDYARFEAASPDAREQSLQQDNAATDGMPSRG